MLMKSRALQKRKSAVRGAPLDNQFSFFIPQPDDFDFVTEGRKVCLHFYVFFDN